MKMFQDMQLKILIPLQKNISLEESSNLSRQNVTKIIHEIHNNSKYIRVGWTGKLQNKSYAILQNDITVRNSK